MASFEIGDAEFEEIRRTVHAAAGITLGGSKAALVVARLGKRLKVHGYATFREYCRHLRERDPDGHELREMINCVTTNKTEFFREPHHFAWLRDKLVPELQQRARATGEKRVRVWSAGCSTGQEPYSIAMVLAEAFAGAGWDIRILASDIDTQVLARAQAGLYDEGAADDVPEPLRGKYLERRGDGLMVATAVRELVTFRRVNLIERAWPIRVKFHAIFCRNVTIYFDRPTQEALYERFCKQIVPDGYLVAGHSENLHWLSRILSPEGNTVYRAVARAPMVSRRPPRLSLRPPRVSRRPPPPPDVPIQSGGLHVSAAPAVVRTTLGSCVALCLFDPEARMGGMNHFMLPEGEVADGSPNRFGTHAMQSLHDELVKLGAEPARLRAKLFGGGHVLRNMGRTTIGTVPDLNVESARRFLEARRIPLVAEKVGGTLPLMVRFETHTGKAFVRTVHASEVDAGERGDTACQEQSVLSLQPGEKVA